MLVEQRLGLTVIPCLAGAYADPAGGAALVFKADDREVVERFVAGDPYGREGLVTGYRIREWTVVLGGDNDVTL